MILRRASCRVCSLRRRGWDREEVVPLSMVSKSSSPSIGRLSSSRMVGTDPRIEREYDDATWELVDTRLGVRSRSCSGARWFAEGVDDTLLLHSWTDVWVEPNDTWLRTLGTVLAGGRAVGGVLWSEPLERVCVEGDAMARTGERGGVEDRVDGKADDRREAAVFGMGSMGVMTVGDWMVAPPKLPKKPDMGPMDGALEDNPEPDVDGMLDGMLDVATLTALVVVPVLLALLEPPASRCSRAKRSLELLLNGRSRTERVVTGGVDGVATGMRERGADAGGEGTTGLSAAGTAIAKGNLTRWESGGEVGVDRSNGVTGVFSGFDARRLTEDAFARARTEGLAICARMKTVRDTRARSDGEFSSRLLRSNISLSGTPCSRHAERKRSMLAEMRVSSFGTLTR